jgi:hypothetical protein
MLCREANFRESVAMHETTVDALITTVTFWPGPERITYRVPGMIGEVGAGEVVALVKARDKNGQVIWRREMPS